ncbi:universal stress protein [Marinigracilibium pacificum]|uniref:Universal stress protein n=1 Tax=Marinigracilibium pacificum TaxID=2729599 RepID=A0A848IYA8_9BACT|nr:universal stress protein [Marinigracilibium pacificum]NMM46969.1 universal stress protein [Marinigracilibium pacificum]
MVKQFKHAIVALDNSPMDINLVKYASMFSSVVGLEQLEFIHIIKDLQYDDSEDIPLDEKIESSIQELVDEHFKSDTNFKIQVKKGNPSQDLLEWVKIKHADLMFIGNKDTLKGHNVLGTKLSNIAPCSLLFVPESFNPEIKKVAIATDFSEQSLSGVEFVKEAMPSNIESELIHVFVVPSGYHFSGKTYEEFSEIMKNNAEKDYQKFIKKHDLHGINCGFILDDDDNPADKILNQSKVHEIDLLVVSSQGRSSWAGLVLGSTAAKILKINRAIPLLILKNKKENLSFFEAILKV